jgi:hypothetical protein
MRAVSTTSQHAFRRCFASMELHHALLSVNPEPAPHPLQTLTRRFAISRPQIGKGTSSRGCGKTQRNASTEVKERRFSAA